MIKGSRRKFFMAAGGAVAGLATARAAKALGADITGLGPPNAGKARRWAMVIDIRKLKPDAASRIAQACHAAHNVPDIPDEKHKVAWIWPDRFERVFAGQDSESLPAAIKAAPVLALCNHCQNPPCVRVCPTKATFQRQDGIVMMDYHRCIGCRYCMAACPYGSRSFNWVDPRKYLKTMDPAYPTRIKGVVEKCDFCEERLAKGRAPACVEACKNGEMIFGDIFDPDSEASRSLRGNFTILRRPELGTRPQVFYII